MTHQIVHFERVQQQQQHFHTAALAAVDHQCPLSLVSHFLNELITDSLFHMCGNWAHVVKKCWLMNHLVHVEIVHLPKENYEIIKIISALSEIELVKV